METVIIGYKPEKITDENNFDIIKGKGLVCKVNSSMIDTVEAGVSERDGQAYDEYKRLKYELEVVSTDNKGRRFWKTFNLSSKKADKKGKLPIHKLLDIYFTCGVPDVGISSEDESVYIEEIRKMNDAFVDTFPIVSAWGFTPDGESDAIQMHKIVGVSEETPVVTSTDVPF